MGRSRPTGARDRCAKERTRLAQVRVQRGFGRDPTERGAHPRPVDLITPRSRGQNHQLVKRPQRDPGQEVGLIVELGVSDRVDDRIGGRHQRSAVEDLCSGQHRTPPTHHQCGVQFNRTGAPGQRHGRQLVVGRRRVSRGEWQVSQRGQTSRRWSRVILRHQNVEIPHDPIRRVGPPARHQGVQSLQRDGDDAGRGQIVRGSPCPDHSGRPRAGGWRRTPAAGPAVGGSSRGRSARPPGPAHRPGGQSTSPAPVPRSTRRAAGHGPQPGGGRRPIGRRAVEPRPGEPTEAPKTRRRDRSHRNHP